MKSGEKDPAASVGLPRRFDTPAQRGKTKRNVAQSHQNTSLSALLEAAILGSQYYSFLS